MIEIKAKMHDAVSELLAESNGNDAFYKVATLMGLVDELISDYIVIPKNVILDLLQFKENEFDMMPYKHQNYKEYHLLLQYRATYIASPDDQKNKDAVIEKMKQHLLVELERIKK